ncbi:MAG: hypothetical protein MUD17_13075 [Gemmatimonadaceae bacterium]|jgi:hypothetical protein|nr:hypothetical protein [Gemmatimonadaceae bacterium]
MSISGLPQNPLLAPLGRPLTSPNTGAGSAGTPAPAVGRNTPAPVDRTALTGAARPAIAAAPSTVPAEAPAGTDPALWSMLTTEERAFFAKSATLGPLTYGRIKDAIMPAPPAARGVRLDVRA